MTADEATPLAVLDYNPLMPGLPLSHIEDIDSLRGSTESSGPVWPRVSGC